MKPNDWYAEVEKWRDKMKHTQEELQHKSDNELDELVAIASGVKILGKSFNSQLIVSNDNGGVQQYHPTANTTEGRAQCWDLMIKYKLDFDVELGTYSAWTKKENGALTLEHADHENPQRAVVIAAILSLQGD